MNSHRLKVERELRGWSQAKVAEAVGTNVRTVIRWEQGQTAPYPHYREQLCALFGKNARELGLLVDIDEACNEQEKPLDSQPTIPVTAPLFDTAIPVKLGNSGSLVGREPLLAQVKQQLWEGDSFNLIALLGLPGMGKTSLAAALANDQAVRERFRDGILWAGLGQEADVLGHLARWGKLLGIAPADVDNVNSKDSWGRALRAAIGSRRLLLVIDDAWSLEEALAFQVGGAQCAHLLTTRLPHIAFAFAKEGTLLVPELKDIDGLALLARFVPHLVQQDDKSAQELVLAVGGSPLALTLMGNYLAAQNLVARAEVAYARSLAYHALGDIVPAVQSAREATKLAQAVRNITQIVAYTCRTAYSLQLHGKLHEVVQIAQLAALRGTTSVGLPHAVVSWAYIIHADVLREGNRLDEALELALQGVQLSEQTETIVALNLAYTVLMHVYQARGELDAAHLAFEKAALFSRLKMQESMQALTGYLDTVLATSPQNGNEYESQSERVEQRTMSQSLLDPLSKRELDVLRLIARGDSNAEIAKELVLALDTVKRHVYNLFSKLGVKNRMQAVASVRALGLLSKEL